VDASASAWHYRSAVDGTDEIQKLRAEIKQTGAREADGANLDSGSESRLSCDGVSLLHRTTEEYFVRHLL
jgi:hypothetical protein